MAADGDEGMARAVIADQWAHPTTRAELSMARAIVEIVDADAASERNSDRAERGEEVPMAEWDAGYARCRAAWAALLRLAGTGGGAMTTRAKKARTLLLCCPKCKRRQTMKRIPTDPERAHSAVIMCPQCVGGDFESSPIYRDAKGLEIPKSAPVRRRKVKK